MTSLLPIEQNTDVVTLAVEVRGAALPDRIPIRHVEVVRQVNRIPYARLKIVDGDAARADFAISADEYFLPGTEIAIMGGYHGISERVFAGMVTSQRIVVKEGTSWLEVECRDVATKTTLSRRCRHFEDVTDSDAVATILEEYGIEADLADTFVTHGQLLQYQSSDWDFLVTRLEANGQLVAVEDGVVRSFVPTLEPPGNTEVLFGTNLLELEAEFDARSQPGGVTAQAWDPAAQELAESAAADPGLVANNDVTAEDLAAASGREGDLVWHGGALASDALQALADAALLRARLAGARGRARFQGLSTLSLGQTVTLSGLGTRFNGGVMVSGIRHLFAGNAWTTDMEYGLDPAYQAQRFDVTAPPAAAVMPAVSGLLSGVVTAIADDPAGENRIRVRLPIAGAEEEGVWARLATLDAGPERGTFFRPEINDEVVVGFFHDDPGFPVILGMLHSSALAPPEAPTADNHLKGYVSRAGLRLQFDDENGGILLSTPEGNSLSLSDGDGGITLEDQNGNRIAMTSDGIALSSGAAVEISATGDLTMEGQNATMAGTQAATVDGGAEATLSAGGQLTISGALVMIN